MEKLVLNSFKITNESNQCEVKRYYETHEAT